MSAFTMTPRLKRMVALSRAAVAKRVESGACVVRQPGVCGGNACIRGTRLRPTDLFENIRAGMTTAQLCGEYRLTREQVLLIKSLYRDVRAWFGWHR